MAETTEAKANPEKRLFISLLTRDIPLADAFLDLIDNSLNSALATHANNLRTADGYVKLLEGAKKGEIVEINLNISATRVVIEDYSCGIKFTSARDHVFQFGREKGSRDATDRLSVYGVGLKRAIFKMGNQINIVSNHSEGGFSTSLKVDRWERDKRQPWVIDISKLPIKPKRTGTRIEITELYQEVKTRIGDGLFIDELKTKIRRAYEFFLNKIVKIQVNGDPIEPFSLSIGDNHASDSFSKGGVTCSIVAGIGQPDSRGFFVDDRAGWTIFCNGRALLFADKSGLTGWTGGSEMPLFQPKHRPFVGLVFFVSDDPELLPWTTTKSAVNRESVVWQEARKRMIAVGRQVTSVLDRRYNNDGTTVSKSEVAALGGKSASALKLSLPTAREFKVRKAIEPDTIRIQYDAGVVQIDAIRQYLRRRSMSGSDVGRHTFQYFLKNRVGFDA